MPYLFRGKPIPHRLPVTTMNAFWKRLDAGHLEKMKTARELRGRAHMGFSSFIPSVTPVPVTARLLGRVRKMVNPQSVSRYLACRADLARVARRKRDHVIFFPAPVLGIDKKNSRICEMVFPYPNAWAIRNTSGLISLSRESRYARNYDRLLNHRGITFSEAKDLVENAVIEMTRVGREEAVFDNNSENFIVVDFDPKTKKPIFVIIDFINPGP